MQNSKVLQNITIHTTLDIGKHQMLETFSMCPMGSETRNFRKIRLNSFVSRKLWSLFMIVNYGLDHKCDYDH